MFRPIRIFLLLHLTFFNVADGVLWFLYFSVVAATYDSSSLQLFLKCDDDLVTKISKREFTLGMYFHCQNFTTYHINQTHSSGKNMLNYKSVILKRPSNESVNLSKIIT